MEEKSNMQMIAELTEHLSKKETELKKSEQRLRTVLDLAPLGMFLVTNRVIRWSNKRLCDLTGYSFEELKFQSTRILYKDDAEFIRVGEAVYTGALEASTKTKIMKKDGSLLPCTLHVVLIDQCDNDAVVATYIDVLGECDGR